jgi:CheY-like chemotaxis protein
MATSTDTLLIVDDNPTNLKLARVVMEDAGYDVHVAVDATTALEKLGTMKPRLILMDIALPDMNGLELTRQLKHDPRYKDILIVALTAYAMKDDRAKALAAGFDEYVTKPINVEGLQQTVAKLLAR